MKVEVNTEYLSKILDATNKILDKVRAEVKANNYSNFNVNWARTYCIDVMHCISYDGNEIIQVWISDAQCNKLELEVRNQLMKTLNFTDTVLEVRTEW